MAATKYSFAAAYASPNSNRLTFKPKTPYSLSINSGQTGSMLMRAVTKRHAVKEINEDKYSGLSAEAAEWKRKMDAELEALNKFITDVDAENWDELITNSKQVWLVLFWSQNCGHCPSTKTVMRKAAKQLETNGPNVKVAFCNVIENMQIAKREDVRVAPFVKVYNTAYEIDPVK